MGLALTSAIYSCNFRFVGAFIFLPLILSVKHLFARDDIATTSRNIWLLVLVFAPLIGVILYFFFGRNSN